MKTEIYQGKISTAFNQGLRRSCTELSLYDQIQYCIKRRGRGSGLGDTFELLTFTFSLSMARYPPKSYPLSSSRCLQCFCRLQRFYDWSGKWPNKKNIKFHGTNVRWPALISTKVQGMYTYISGTLNQGVKPILLARKFYHTILHRNI